MARISLFVELDLLLIILNEETDLLKSDLEFFTFFATNFDCRAIFVNTYISCTYDVRMYRTLSHAKSLFGNTNLDLFDLK